MGFRKGRGREKDSRQRVFFSAEGGEGRLDDKSVSLTPPPAVKGAAV
jgi:hypothetical protein